MEGLRGRGYSQAEINKIMGGNTLRVWQAVEAYAEQMGNPTVCAGCASYAALPSTTTPVLSSS